MFLQNKQKLLVLFLKVLGNVNVIGSVYSSNPLTCICS